MALFSSVDPSGVYRDFVKQALHSEPQRRVLWVWGSGNNGKTTLASAIRRAYPMQTRNIPWDCPYYSIKDVRLGFVRDVPENWFPSLLNTAIIVESNQPPPPGLVCTSLQVTSQFNNPTYQIEVGAVRELLSH